MIPSRKPGFAGLIYNPVITLVTQTYPTRKKVQYFMFHDFQKQKWLQQKKHKNLN